MGLTKCGKVKIVCFLVIVQAALTENRKTKIYQCFDHVTLATDTSPRGHHEFDAKDHRGMVVMGYEYY